MTTRLHFLPDYSASNPYQRMLYRRLPDHDIAPRAVRLRELGELPARSPSGERSVLHLHWTNSIVQRHPDPLNARRSMRSFLREVDRLRSGGAVLLWTIHNVLPHDYRHHVLELELHRSLAERADIVHTITPRTLELVQGYYELDASRVMCVPHSTFAGEYPPAVPRVEARRSLGIGLDEAVIAMVGALRPYRGAERLLDALDQLEREGSSPLLLLGGAPTSHPTMATVLDRARRSPRVIVKERALDNDTLSLWMSAADIAAMPYESILNSGSYGLALTYGRPVVAPAAGAFLDEAEHSFVHLFTPGDTTSLVEALHKALEPSTLSARAEAAQAAGAQRPPELMATQFATSLAARLHSLGTRALD